MKVRVGTGLALVGVLLSACTPKPAPTPTPAPTSCACVVPAPSAEWVPAQLDTPVFNGAYLQQAENAVGARCGKPVADTLEVLGSQLQDQALCAGHWGEGLLIHRPDGLWEEFRPVDTQSGCYVTIFKAYKSAWQFTGPSAKGCK